MWSSSIEIRLCWLVGFCWLWALGGAARAQVDSAGYLPWSSGQARFLSREFYPWWDERYENYSLLSYRDYADGSLRSENPTYDPFGAYLLDGGRPAAAGRVPDLGPPTQQSDFSQRRQRPQFGRPRSATWWLCATITRVGSTRLMIGDALEGDFTALTPEAAPYSRAALGRFLPTRTASRWWGRGFRRRLLAAPTTGPSPPTCWAATGRVSWAMSLSFGASYVNLHLRDSLRRHGSFPRRLPQ